MVLYTPMPLETVFEGYDDNFNSYLEMKEISYEGVTMIVTPEKDQYKIQRVISTDPNDYLNPDFQPGNLIKL